MIYERKKEGKGGLRKKKKEKTFDWLLRREEPFLLVRLLKVRRRPIVASWPWESAPIEWSLPQVERGEKEVGNKKKRKIKLLFYFLFFNETKSYLKVTYAEIGKDVRRDLHRRQLHYQNVHF